LAGASRR